MIQMARSARDNELITYKVRQLQAEGKGLKQAQAIALRMYRDGELRGTSFHKKFNSKKYNKKFNTLLKKAMSRELYGRKR